MSVVTELWGDPNTAQSHSEQDPADTTLRWPRDRWPRDRWPQHVALEVK